MKMSIKMIRNAVMTLIVLTVLTGIIYPLAITGISQAVFPAKANGSIIMKDGKPVGSALIGQQFDGPEYFWGRPSATTPYPYNGSSSSGSNLGPNNPALMEAVKARVAALHAAGPGNRNPIPVDLVTSSGSGLDPAISPAAALYQAGRVARARGLDEAKVLGLIQANTNGRFLGIFGEPAVNVLKLNLSLDEMGK
ncbi:MAG: potassium-transporting ATPase subunit KdpC [Nitrospiraceae bacterium]|nr:potassium-transporting ATPase subunit KdpC [Nitrospiraceae bacterium]